VLSSSVAKLPHTCGHPSQRDLTSGAVDLLYWKIDGQVKPGLATRVERSA